MFFLYKTKATMHHIPVAQVAIAVLYQWSSVLTLQRIGKKVPRTECPMYRTSEFMPEVELKKK